MQAFRVHASCVPARVILSGIAIMLMATLTAPLAVAQSDASPPPDQASAALMTVAAAPDGTPPGVPDPAAQRRAYVRALADKLGISEQSLQSAIDAVTQQLGAMPLPGPAATPSPPPGANVIVSSPDLGGIASMLGISTAQLTQEWSKQGLADVARAHQVSPDAVGALYKKARLAQLDQAVSSGQIGADAARVIRDHVDLEVTVALDLPRPDLGSIQPSVR